MTGQAASPIFTNVYATLVAIINTKLPQIGELITKRLILNFKKGYHRNDKVSITYVDVWNGFSDVSCVPQNLCMASTQLLAHLINQQVVSCTAPLIFAVQIKYTV